MKVIEGDTQAKKHKPGSPGATGGRGREPGKCPSCGTVVEAKPGFRFASLKCPKCGTPMGRQ